MAVNAVTAITNCFESRTSHSQFHTREYELNNNNDPRNSGGNNHYNVRVSIKQMVWRKCNTYFSKLWRYSRFRFNLYSTYSWRSLYVRSNNKGSKSGVIHNRNRKRNRHYFYYGLLISLLSVAPVRADEGETNNTSNPVAAATGNVTNQAVQFQNNGAPSRQHYGSNISCNGSTMTFSPFYMGNHTKPWDIDDGQMTPSSYTLGENWGFQVNFMVPLDKRGLERCRSIAARQEDKMRLDYELVRVLKCAELQQKGFMLVPESRVYSMCSDVIPIVAWKKVEEQAKKDILPPQPPKKWWQKLNPLNK